MYLSNKTIIKIKTYDETYAINTILPEIGNVLSISSLSVDIGYDAKYESIEEVYFQIVGTESTLLIRSHDVIHIYYKD